MLLDSGRECCLIEDENALQTLPSHGESEEATTWHVVWRCMVAVRLHNMLGDYSIVKWGERRLVLCTWCGVDNWVRDEPGWLLQCIATMNRRSHLPFQFRSKSAMTLHVYDGRRSRLRPFFDKWFRSTHFVLASSYTACFAHCHVFYIYAIMHRIEDSIFRPKRIHAG